MPRYICPQTPKKPRSYTFHDSPKKNRFIGAVQAQQKPYEEVPAKVVESVGARYDIPPSSARRIWKKFNETGSTHTLRQMPGPRKLTNEVKSEIIAVARADRWMPLDELGRQVDPPLSRASVRHILREVNLHRRHARKVPRMTKKVQEARVEWALDQQVLGAVSGWDWVVWSDEAYIVQGEKKGVFYVTRAPVRRCLLSLWLLC
jgi:transposase